MLKINIIFICGDIIPVKIINSDILSIFIETIKLQITLIYHPYWENKKAHEEMLSVLHTYIGPNLPLNSKYIIAGDLNGLADNLENFCLSNRCTQLVNFSTRNTRTLDILLTNCPDKWRSPEKLAPLMNADHSIIKLNASSINPNKITVWSVHKRIFAKKDLKLFESKMCLIDWAFLHSYDNVDACSNAFYSTIWPLIDSCFPFKKVKMRSDDKYWINPYIKDLMNQKDRAYKKGH